MLYNAVATVGLMSPGDVGDATLTFSNKNGAEQQRGRGGSRDLFGNFISEKRPDEVDDDESEVQSYEYHWDLMPSTVDSSSPFESYKLRLSSVVSSSSSSSSSSFLSFLSAFGASSVSSSSSSSVPSSRPRPNPPVFPPGRCLSLGPSVSPSTPVSSVIIGLPRRFGSFLLRLVTRLAKATAAPLNHDGETTKTKTTKTLLARDREEEEEDDDDNYLESCALDDIPEEEDVPAGGKTTRDDDDDSSDAKSSAVVPVKGKSVRGRLAEFFRSTKTWFSRSSSSSSSRLARPGGVLVAAPPPQHIGWQVDDQEVESSRALVQPGHPSSSSSSSSSLVQLSRPSPPRLLRLVSAGGPLERRRRRLHPSYT